MKVLKYLSAILLFTIFSCTSVKITSDYNRKTDFSKFKTFAFYKKGINKVDLSRQDKRKVRRSKIKFVKWYNKNHATEELQVPTMSEPNSLGEKLYE